jgi:regulator of cell morphogenesis and NO signaling
MDIHENKIHADTCVTEIVAHDYRTADVFRKYDIDFCCGGKMPLDTACKAAGIDTEEVLKELKRASKPTFTGKVPEFDEWNLDFLSDYILNIHHRYLSRALPDVNDYVNRFLEGHRKKFPELAELEKIMAKMMKEIPPHMKKEEEVIFPYIKQIYHAWRHRESYASLLIRTLRKPVEDVMQAEHESVGKQLHRMREITHNYTLPSNPCLTHRVTYAKLRELDLDLVEHIHLENNILFPKAIAMEKELLQFKD